MPRRFSKLFICLPALLLGVGPAAAAPGDPIGSAVSVVNLVTAQIDQDERRLAIGDDVRQQELIEVDDDGRSELILRDDTKLALGPGSRLLLDKFVYDPDISGGAIVLDLVRGTFRFITGIAAKPAYVIRTPTASITVRGTIFDVYVQTSGLAWILLIEGAIEVCTETNQCVLHDEPGKLIRIGTDKVDKPVKWASLSETEDVPFETAFPFIAAAPGFDPRPIFTPDDIVDDKGDGGGKKAEEPKRKKVQKKPTKKKARKTRRKSKSKEADAKKIIKGLNVIIGIGAGMGRGGGGGGRGGGGGHRGGNYR